MIVLVKNIILYMQYLPLLSEFVISVFQLCIYIKNYDNNQVKISIYRPINSALECKAIYNENEYIQKSSITDSTHPALDTSVFSALATIAGYIAYYNVAKHHTEFRSSNHQNTEFLILAGCMTCMMYYATLDESTQSNDTESYINSTLF